MHQSAGTLQVSSSIIAGNSDLGGESADCGGDLTSLDFNVLENAQGCNFSSQANDQIGAPAGLDPNLDFNGGLTPTHALLMDSIAINHGDPGSACTQSPVNSIDQRQVPRDPLCDAGAYESELQVLVPQIPALSPWGAILMAGLDPINGLLSTYRIFKN